MAFDLTGHVALVTGNSSGLGKAIGMALGCAGAKVAVNYQHNTERAERTAQEYRQAGIDTILVRADAVSESGVERMYDEVEAKLGIVDILIPNATCEQPQLPIEQYDWDFYQRMLDFFVKSPFLLTKRGLAPMKQKRWGRIINIVSEVYHRSVPNFSAYVAAKGAQIGWSRSMASELAPSGITVNMIAPGWIPTERHANAPAAERDAYVRLVPAGRWGVPEDVAEAAVYLASEEASFVTGQTLCVNGGMTPW